MNRDIISDHAKYQKGWTGGLPETRCGYGSKLSQTKFQRQWLPEMVAKYGIESIADLGAGDLNWIKHTEPGCEYKAYDLIPRKPEVQKLDLLHDKLPDADCLLVLWVLNHFPPAQQKTAIDKIKNSTARFIIMTHDRLMEPCTDLPFLEQELLRKGADGRDLNIRLIRNKP